MRRSVKRPAVSLGAAVLGAFMLAAPTVVSAAGTVSVMGTWGGQELEAFLKVLEPFEEATGIDVQFEGTRDLTTVLTTRVEAGNPPDVTGVPSLGLVADLASRGELVPLDRIIDMDQFRRNYKDVWVDLGSVNGELFAIPFSADLKSLVWYNVKAFEANGYDVPETWDEMEALADRIVADGGTPWSIGLESGGASGWPGTDWIEDIMLRTAGPDVYDQWVAHDIPWTDPAVRRAFEMFGDIAGDPSRVYGGPATELTMNFGDAANPLFTSPPGAYLHRQASFVVSFIKEANPAVQAGEDYNFFPLPAIDEAYGVPALGAADLFSMLNDTPEARALMYYLTTPRAQEIWVSELGKLSPNQAVDAAAYPDALTRQMADALASAEVFRFDGSDAMPAAIGSGAFFQGILNYVSGEDLDSVLEMIEAAADDAYDSGAATD